MSFLRRFWRSALMSMRLADAAPVSETTAAGSGTADRSLASRVEATGGPESNSDRFETAFGTVEVVSRAALLDHPAWLNAFAGCCKDGRYYEICEATLRQANFDYRYLILRDKTGIIRALQPFFFTDQDLTAGMSASMRAPIVAVRKRFPGFLSMKMLMVGCTAGEGHLAVTDYGDRREATDALLDALRIYARAKKAAIITFKDFPSEYRAAIDAPAARQGFVRMPSFPATILPLGQFRNFEDYVAQRLGKSMRKNLRRKFRQPDPVEGVPAVESVIMEVVNDVSHCIDDVYPLYQQVLARSDFRFEELTKEYFCQLGQTMPERVRFFIWRQGGKAVAFSACMVHDGKLYDNYLGLDYRVAHDLHLYFVTIRDLISWGIEQKLTWYYSTPLNYDPKLHLRFDLAPLDLYVRHVSNWINPFFKRIAPVLEPTRYDKLLRQFANHADIL